MICWTCTLCHIDWDLVYKGIRKEDGENVSQNVKLARGINKPQKREIMYNWATIWYGMESTVTNKINNSKFYMLYDQIHAIANAVYAEHAIKCTIDHV